MGTTNHRTARSRRYWESAAPRYDKQMALLEKVLIGGGRRWLARRAEGRILEVAIGTGRSLPRYPAGTALTGIDLSPAMLAIARSRAADLGVTADLRVGDAHALPFNDTEFDTVVCAQSLCAIPDPATAIDEMSRVLVPGGRLLLLDHVGSTWPRSMPRNGWSSETRRANAGTVERVFARKVRRG